MSVKPEVELIFTNELMENTFKVKYLENGDRDDDYVDGSRLAS